MNKYTFFSESTFWEIWTVIFRMYEGAFLIGIIAIWPVSTPDLLFIVLVSISFCSLFLFFQPDIVLVVTQIDHRICWINFDLLKYWISWLLIYLLPLILTTFWIRICSPLICCSLLTYSIKYISFFNIISFSLITFIQCYNLFCCLIPFLLLCWFLSFSSCFL
jgi:hypothetical protein